MTTRTAQSELAQRIDAHHHPKDLAVALGLLELASDASLTQQVEPPAPVDSTATERGEATPRADATPQPAPHQPPSDGATAVTLPPIHLVIIQPKGYVHSLGFLDQARFFRHQFERLGATVTLGKNRLRADAINFVFGAHLGFTLEASRQHTCMIVNLEQLGAGGATVTPEYLRLLQNSAVVDIDSGNVSTYAADPLDVPLVSFGFAPYLCTEPILELADRPIDLLFFGSMNPRRKALIDRIEACGVSVSTFDSPLYAEERDRYIRQAKAVWNCHYYDTSRFEQARVFHCLSLGTPVISERSPRTVPPPAFEDALFWLRDEELADFFLNQFGREPFIRQAEQQLLAFAQHDPLESYADLLAFAKGYWQAQQGSDDDKVWQPQQVNLGSGKDYKPGWLNIDVLARAQPDLVLDLGQAQTFPLTRTGELGQTIRLAPASLHEVYANNVLEHVPDLPMLMTNVLTLLAPGGLFEIEVPYEHAVTAWQDPTHLRALNEKSWIYYTDWFWYLGWFEWRFEVARSSWLDLQLKPCDKAQAAFMKVTLRKIETTPRERTHARTLQADFGGLVDDAAVLAAWQSNTVAIEPTPGLSPAQPTALAIEHALEG